MFERTSVGWMPAKRLTCFRLCGTRSLSLSSLRIAVIYVNMKGTCIAGYHFFFAFWKGACRLVLEHDGTWGSRIIGCWDSIPTSSANRVAFNQPYFARDFSLPSLGFSNLRQKRARRLTQIPSVFIMHAWIGRSDRRLSAIS